MFKKLLPLYFFLFICLAATSEMVLSNLFTLFTAASASAQIFGITQVQEVQRLIFLSALDAAIAVTALIALRSFWRKEYRNYYRYAEYCGIALLGYGSYQITSSLTLLAVQFKLAMSVIGIIYGMLGLIAFYFSSRHLRK